MLKDAFYRLFLLEELGAPAAGQDYLGPSPYPYNSSSSFLQASSSKNLPSVIMNNIMTTKVKQFLFNNLTFLEEVNNTDPLMDEKLNSKTHLQKPFFVF
jgi:hypothetical protein